ncbi:hypothetical protein P4S72_10790 [Vibrio sp. PP-XX7]
MSRGATLPTEGAIGSALNTFIDLLDKNRSDIGLNWLFVLGGGNEFTNSTDNTNDQGRNITPWNITPVVRVDSHGSISMRSVLKNYTSDIDYAPRGQDPRLGNINRPNLVTHKRIHAPNYGENGHGLLDIDDIKVGIEVCLDYAYDTLNQLNIPVRLLTSGGMSFLDKYGDSHLSKDTRLAFNVDCLRSLANDAIELYKYDPTNGLLKINKREDIEIKRLSNKHLFQWC